MAIRFDERPDSRALSANPPKIDLKYNLSGISDDVTAYSFALSATPSAWLVGGQTLWRSDLQLDPRGFELWTVSVPYIPENRQVGQWDFDFDTSGGTVHITQSKSTTAFPPGAPDHKGAIDVEGDTVKGGEIVIPALRMSYSFRWASGAVNEAMARNLARATGKTNSVAWHGFAAGELLFLGATGRNGSSCETTLTYHMAASENVTGLTIGAIAGVAKKGHEMVWISYKPAVDAGEKVRQPQFCYVEKVYGEMNFAATLGF